MAETDAAIGRLFISVGATGLGPSFCFGLRKFSRSSSYPGCVEVVGREDDVGILSLDCLVSLVDGRSSERSLSDCSFMDEVGGVVATNDPGIESDSATRDFEGSIVLIVDSVSLTEVSDGE